MKSIYFLILFGCLISSCQFRSGSGEETGSEPEFVAQVQTLNALVRNKANYLPHIEIDSILIRDRQYRIFVTDKQLTYTIPPRIEQNVQIILRDFCCLELSSPPFDRVSVQYQLPLRDQSGYFQTYTGSLEETRQFSHLFSNDPFSESIKGLTLIHKDYPQNNVLDHLNMHWGMVRHREDEAELAWFGLNFFNFVLNYLVECETGQENYYQDKLESVLNLMRTNPGDLNQAEAAQIASRVELLLREKCRFMQSLSSSENPTKIQLN